MKDVDPDVAALLDDLPKTKLPQPLITEGWGRWSIDDVARVPVKPSETQAPTYMETCCQCGRPITNARRGGGWWDHAGKTECDGAIVAEKSWDQHYPQSEVDRMKAYVAEERENLARWAAKEARITQQLADEEKARRMRSMSGPCGANKHGHSCPHECSGKGQHFGFHECKYCRYLWK